MKANNGIYILHTPECCNGFFTGNNEFRVAYASEINNIERGVGAVKNTSKKAYSNKIDIGELYEILIFGDLEVFPCKDHAMRRAEELHKKLGPTEYGIVIITRHYPFCDNITKEEALEMLEIYHTNNKNPRATLETSV